MIAAATLAALLTLGAVAATPKKTRSEKPRSELRHVVAFKFKDSVKPEEIKRVEDAFASLKDKIPQVQRYEWGMNNSPEGLNQGCTHGFILTFNSEKDRNAYLEHPDHKAFGALVKPLIDVAFVMDFWIRH